MEMFLTVAAMSIVGVGVSALLFAAATRNDRDQPLPAERRTVVIPAATFFAEQSGSSAHPPVSVDALLLQLEHHVRLEHAAAEAFVMLPTRELLHSRTASPLH